MKYKKYQLNTTLEDLFVDGIVRGHASYLDECITKSKELPVSEGYAWTRGNHIDSMVAHSIDRYSEENKEEDFKENIKWIKARAGTSWEYIEFIIENNNKNYLVMIKGRSNLINRLSQDTPKYLKEKSKINNDIYNEIDDEFRIVDDQVQFTYIDDPIDDIINLAENFSEEDEQQSFLDSNYDGFYILLYNINNKNGKIDSIDLNLPVIVDDEMKLLFIDNYKPRIDYYKDLDSKEIREASKIEAVSYKDFVIETLVPKEKEE